MLGTIVPILAPVPHVSTSAATPGSSSLNATIWVSIAGIVVSGVVGPQITSWSTRALIAGSLILTRTPNAGTT